MAAADVSIAIGSGSDVALSSASFILVSSNLSGVVTLVDLSTTVFRRVKFNFVSPATGMYSSTADRGLLP